MSANRSVGRSTATPKNERSAVTHKNNPSAAAHNDDRSTVTPKKLLAYGIYGEHIIAVD
jgi:hypothetical protein